MFYIFADEVNFFVKALNASVVWMKKQSRTSTRNRNLSEWRTETSSNFFWYQTDLYQLVAYGAVNHAFTNLYKGFTAFQIQLVYFVFEHSVHSKYTGSSLLANNHKTNTMF